MNDSRWKTSASDKTADLGLGDEARNYGSYLLQYLRESPRLDQWTDDYLASVQKSTAEIKGWRGALDTKIFRIMQQLSREAVPEASFEALEANYKDLAEDLEAHKHILAMWLRKIEEDQTTLKQKQADIKQFIQSIQAYNEWIKPKVTSKGKTSLGTPFKFEILEISHRDTKWQTYNTTIQRRNYRIAPESPGDKNWRIDVGGGAGWEALTPVAYSSPKEAAKALAEKLGGPAV